MSAARYPCCDHCTGRCDTPDDHPIPCLWEAACIEVTQTPIYSDPDVVDPETGRVTR